MPGSEARAILSLPAHLSGLEVLETLASLETLNPIFRKACSREVTRAHAARRDHESRRGVRFSGLDADPYTVKPVERIVAEAEAIEARMQSPRGRFCAALNGVEKVDPVGAERLRGLWNRSLADDRQPLDTAAVGAALAVLNGIAGQAARDAIEALACLLMDASRRAA